MLHFLQLKHLQNKFLLNQFKSKNKDNGIKFHRFINCGQNNKTMALKAAIAMSAISIAMLAIYGADAIMASTENLGPQSTAFLHTDVMTRGVIFGIIPAAMLIISFFITRKESSKRLGILIIIVVALMIIGVGVILVLQGNSIQTAGKGDFVAVVGIGIVIVILGGLKIKKSTKITTAQ